MKHQPVSINHVIGMKRNYENLKGRKISKRPTIRATIYIIILCLFLVQTVSAAEETIEINTGKFIIQAETQGELAQVKNAFNKAYANSDFFKSIAESVAASAGEEGVRIMVNDPKLNGEGLGGSKWEQSKFAVHLGNIDSVSDALGVDSEILLQSVMVHEMSHLGLRYNGDTEGRDNPGGPHVEFENKFLENIDANFRRLNYLFTEGEGENEECYTDFGVWTDGIGKRMTLKHSDYTAEDTTGDYATCRTDGNGTTVGGFVLDAGWEQTGSGTVSFSLPSVVLLVTIGLLVVCRRKP